MKNPFPGMNPYLEASWGDVHATLLVYARNQLQRQLPSDLKARVEEDLKVDGLPKDSGYRPDVSLWEAQRPRESTGGSLVRESTFTQPLIMVADPKPRRRIQITDAAGTLITVIEFLSPTNKRGHGAVAYQRKREDLMGAGVNLVEVDLVRKGGSMVSLFEDESFEKILLRKYPKLPPYIVDIFVAQDPMTRQMYPVSLSDPLPVCRIPLRPADPGVALALQELVDQCYVDGGYTDLDYRQDPEPLLSPEDAAWMDELLKAQGLR